MYYINYIVRFKADLPEQEYIDIEVQAVDTYSAFVQAANILAARYPGNIFPWVRTSRVR